MINTRKNTVDILIVGGGMAGVMAAIAAKDENNSVLIVEPSNVLGGQGTAGGVAGFCGDTKRVNHVFQNLIEKLIANNFIDDYQPNSGRRAYDLEWCAFYIQEMVSTHNIQVLLHSRVIDASANNGIIENVQIATAGEVLIYQPGFVIDASGTNIVSVCAGFPGGLQCRYDQYLDTR